MAKPWEKAALASTATAVQDTTPWGKRKATEGERLGISSGVGRSFEEEKANPVMRAIFPSSQGKPFDKIEGQGVLGEIGSGLLSGAEAVGTPFRLAGAALRKDVKFDDPQAGLLAPEAKALRESAVEDAEFDFSAADIAKFGAKKVGAFALDTAPELLAGGLANVGRKGVKSVLKGGQTGLKKMASFFSQVSDEALEAASTKGGRESLKKFAGKQNEIGQNLVDAIDNIDEFLPSKKTVDKALSEMPPIKTASVIKVLEDAKPQKAIGGAKDAVKKIDDLISDISEQTSDLGNIDAVSFRELRKQIDAEVGDAFGKESSKYLSALKAARNRMKTDLVDAATASGNTEFVDAMKQYAEVLGKVDDVNTFLGKTAKTRANRAESFVSTLFGKNKTEKREALKKLEEVFGTNFIEEAKLAKLASEFGESGVPGLVPRGFTGKALGSIQAGLGGAAVVGGGLPGAIIAAPTLAISSPAVATRALGATRSLGRGLRKVPTTQPVRRSALGSGASKLDQKQ